MILVIVYVGAVAVLFLFVVMMLDIDFARAEARRLQISAAGRAVVGILLGCELAAGRLFAWLIRAAAGRVARPCHAGCTSPTPQRSGRILYTDYIYYFQIAGLVLLVAMIGAIVLTLRQRPGVRRQSISGAERAHAGHVGGNDRRQAGAGELMMELI